MVPGAALRVVGGPGCGRGGRGVREVGGVGVGEDGPLGGGGGVGGGVEWVGVGFDGRGGLLVLVVFGQGWEGVVDDYFGRFEGAG